MSADMIYMECAQKLPRPDSPLPTDVPHRNVGPKSGHCVSHTPTLSGPTYVSVAGVCRAVELIHLGRVLSLAQLRGFSRRCERRAGVLPIRGLSK